MNDKPVILVVDDQPQNIELLETYLVPQGYEILKAEDGEEAIRTTWENTIDLVLLDVMMPKIDGFEVCRRIKGSERFRNIPVVMITALKETEDRVKALEAGCDDFISKPVDKHELLATVKSLLRIKSLHEEVGEAREYAESIINTVREPLIALDQDLRVVTASRSFYEVFKVTPKETLGQLIYDLGNKQWDIARLRELLETILPRQATFDNYEVEHDFADIGRRIMLLNARQIHRVWGKKMIILLAIEDITERKRAEEALNQKTLQLELANSELEAYTHSVSHDLRAPVRIIKGFSEAVLEDHSHSLNEESKKLLNSIHRNALRMDELIKALLDLSKVGHWEINAIEIDMDKLAREVFEGIMSGSSEQTLRLETKMLPFAHGDNTLIRQVFVNLLSNAVKFSKHKDKPSIEVGGWSEEKENVYFVKDNGAGFEPKNADKLFGTFQRLHTLQEFEGTGIGLSIVKRIIARHGGRVWAEGKPNEGATFYFTLPKA